MEDVYTIRVKTKPDTRNLYPSERRYSASTVSGLAWVHIALAATSFLLACLALVNPNTEHIGRLNLNDTEQKTVNKSEIIHNLTDEVSTEGFIDNVTIPNEEQKEYGERNSHMLVIAPTLLTVFALGAGLASIMASVRWYIDRNITWLFVMSVLSTACSFVAFVMIAAWFANTSYGDELSDFYKDKTPFKDFFVVKHTDVIDKIESHLIIAMNPKANAGNDSHLFTKRVLSINILIAAFLEFLWSILSVKISYKGMRSNYKEDSSEPRGKCVSVVTKIKGNNAKRYPNGKLLSPKPDLIDHYPNKKIKRIFLASGDSGFYLKNQNGNDKSKENTETSSEFYRDRMMNFLNRCASLEGVSNPDITPSVHSENHLNTIQEVNVEINPETPVEVRDRMTPISWGDTPDHTIYNQDTINFDTLFKYCGKTDVKEEDDVEETSENKD